MKAVCLRLSPASPLLDLTHGIPPQDLWTASVALQDAWPHLPEDAVVCAVVDPGVGTQRRPLILRPSARSQRLLVGPDNGLLAAVAEADARAFIPRVEGPIQPQASATFHGRDVFAPAAALLAAGAIPEQIADPVPSFLPTVLPAAERTATGWRLSVVSIDHFGNVAFNLHRSQVPDKALLRLPGGRTVQGFHRTFGDVPSGEPVLYGNSAGRLELAVRDGNAAQAFGLRVGDEATLRG